MNKTVILGDGLLGSELSRITDWDVHSRKKTGLDINHIKLLLNIVNRYDIIVNCIANTNSYGGSKYDHWKVNYLFPSILSNLCLINDKKLVHISTEFVYANNNHPPTEEEIPLPHNSWYAKSKLLADEYIQLSNSNYLICRLLHKPNPFVYSNVWDVKTSGDTVDKISELVKTLVIKNAQGTFNVGTGDKNLIDLNPNGTLVKPPKHVPIDTRMNLSKLNRFLNE